MWCFLDVFICFVANSIIFSYLPCYGWVSDVNRSMKLCGCGLYLADDCMGLHEGGICSQICLELKFYIIKQYYLLDWAYNDSFIWSSNTICSLNLQSVTFLDSRPFNTCRFIVCDYSIWITYHTLVCRRCHTSHKSSNRDCCISTKCCCRSSHCIASSSHQGALCCCTSWRACRAWRSRCCQPKRCRSYTRSPRGMPISPCSLMCVASDRSVHV